MRALVRERICILHERVKDLNRGLKVKNSYLYNSYKQRIRDTYEEIEVLRNIYFLQYKVYPETDKTKIINYTINKRNG
jgi:predicted thioredoxin/glutaredoxin